MRETARPKTSAAQLSGLLRAAALVCSAAAAHAERLPFKNYTTSDGLAHDHVNRIVRDSRGLL